MDNACYAVKRGGVVILLSECSDIYEPMEFSDWFKHGDIKAVEKVLRDAFAIPGYVAFKEMECSEIATFVMITKKENKELVAKANMIPVETMEEALKIAHEKCKCANPQFIVMPQGANTVPLRDGQPTIG